MVLTADQAKDCYRDMAEAVEKLRKIAVYLDEKSSDNAEACMRIVEAIGCLNLAKKSIQVESCWTS